MKINFESSTACNAKCTFCPRYEMKRPMGEMSDNTFHKIIKDGKDMGVTRFSPFINGEPFVFPKIWEWLDYMQKEGVSVSLYTNAEMIDVDRIMEYKNIEYLNCSLNASTEETYDKIMRGPNFKKVMGNIDRLRKEAPFSVRVSFVVTKDNQHELDSFKAMFRKKRVCYFANWTGDKEDELARTGERGKCWVLFNQMFVLWNGLVVPCCMDVNAKQVLGDVNIQTLKEIWDNAWWMREKHKNLDFDIPVCLKCNYNCNEKGDNLLHA